MIKKLLTVILFFALLSTVAVYALNTAQTHTMIWFNIGILEAVQVQILTQGTWTTFATGAGAPMTNNIDINSTGNEMTWNNASIRGSATAQDVTSPILKIQNAGSVNASINISLNSTITGAATCLIRARYYNASTGASMVFPPTAPDLANSTSALNVTLTSALMPTQGLYLWLFANYSACASTDTTSRNFTIWADYVA
jgi:hypothetical protein